MKELKEKELKEIIQSGHLNILIGGYTDIVYLESKDDAKKAEADMVNIPNANDWYSCYEKGSISSINLNQVATFN